MLAPTTIVLLTAVFLYFFGCIKIFPESSYNLFINVLYCVCQTNFIYIHKGFFQGKSIPFFRCIIHFIEFGKSAYSTECLMHGKPAWILEIRLATIGVCVFHASASVAHFLICRQILNPNSNQRRYPMSKSDRKLLVCTINIMDVLKNELQAICNREQSQE